MAKYADNSNFIPVSVDMSPASYITDYYISPSDDHAIKYPNAILEHLDFMGNLSAIEFWMWLLEPSKPGEDRHMRGKRIVWGYVDRLAQCAAIFVGLNSENQQYILKARKQEQPIWWRGDKMEMFKRIARESYKYNQLSESEQAVYKKNAFKLALGVANAKAS
jgi:hypothetical protein